MPKEAIQPPITYGTSHESESRPVPMPVLISVAIDIIISGLESGFVLVCLGIRTLSLKNEISAFGVSLTQFKRQIDSGYFLSSSLGDSLSGNWLYRASTTPPIMIVRLNKRWWP